jgi:DNA-binding GntR family transcriptional regulator
MLTRTPLREEIHRRIVQRIQSGDLPPGSKLSDQTLAGQLGVSRTPVREALLRLVRDGVLESTMGRGFRLPPLDRTELREVGAILATLEALALRLAPPATQAQLERLAEVDRAIETTRGDVSRCLDLEDEWHAVLLAGCPNRRLLDLIGSHRQIARRYVVAYMRGARRISLSTVPHAQVISELRRGGRDTAAAALEQQWRRAISELEASLLPAPELPITRA